jgi:hypothetical protein
VVGGLRGAIGVAMVADYVGPFSKMYYDCVVFVVVISTLVQVRPTHENQPVTLH